jgi:hypothetical protein
MSIISISQNAMLDSNHYIYATIGCLLQGDCHSDWLLLISPLTVIHSHVYDV